MAHQGPTGQLSKRPGTAALSCPAVASPPGLADRLPGCSPHRTSVLPASTTKQLHHYLAAFKCLSCWPCADFSRHTSVLPHHQATPSLPSRLKVLSFWPCADFSRHTSVLPASITKQLHHYLTTFKCLSCWPCADFSRHTSVLPASIAKQLHHYLTTFKCLSCWPCADFSRHTSVLPASITKQLHHYLAAWKCLSCWPCADFSRHTSVLPASIAKQLHHYLAAWKCLSFWPRGLQTLVVTLLYCLHPSLSTYNHSMIT